MLLLYFNIFFFLKETLNVAGPAGYGVATRRATIDLT